MAQQRHLTSSLELAPKQLRASCGYWDLSLGHHPHLAGHLAELGSKPLYPTAEEWRDLAELDLPMALGNRGHHILADKTYLYAADPSRPDEWPLAPLFVKDLAGRMIHTGLMPLPTPPSTPTFPAGCADVPKETPVAGLLENAIFTLYRRLEIGPTRHVQLAGQPELELQAAYAQPASYTYKLRPDTYYQDGWRLPQVARLYARAVPQAQAEAAVQEFMSRWQSRPAEQDYETFHEANHGDTWFEDLFTRGVTVIPTLEAYNGCYHVADDYTVENVDPGRAVAGLHQVVGRQESNLPAGTILQVTQPGYVTHTQVVPAQVIVSDGTGFAAQDMPEPLLPNLAMPHPRVSPTWGAVWLPTHPQHFAEPALWDWDESGHFIQVSGPLWDPLHYTYASTQSIVRATRKPVEDNAQIFTLPEAMRYRFHPVVDQTWYDTVNERTAQERAKSLDHPLYGSVLDSLPLGVKVAGVGYHPLPAALEYDLDPAVFPNLHPRHRVAPCPEELRKRLAPLAVPAMEGPQLSRHHVIVSEPMRNVLMQATAAPAMAWWGKETENGSSNSVTRTQMQAQAAPAMLPEMAASQLLINVKRLFANRKYRQALQANSPTLAAALFRFREAALSWRRLRYRLFTKYPAVWVQAWVQGLDLSVAETLLATVQPEQHGIVSQMRAKSVTVVGQSAAQAPAQSAGKLRSKGGASKLDSTKLKA